MKHAYQFLICPTCDYECEFRPNVHHFDGYRFLGVCQDKGGDLTWLANTQCRKVKQRSSGVMRLVVLILSMFLLSAVVVEVVSR